MLYILFTLVSGIFSALISIYFRRLELQKKIILMPRQLLLQICIFVFFAFIFGNFFPHVVIDVGFFTFEWFLIYVIFSSFSYYAVQVLYEYTSGNSLFADEAEMKQYIEKLEKDQF